MPLYSMYYPAYPMKITYEKDSDGNISYSAECKEIEFELIKDDYVVTDIFPIEVRIYSRVSFGELLSVDISDASMLKILSNSSDDDGLFYIDLMIFGVLKGSVYYKITGSNVGIFLESKIPRYSMEKPLQVLGVVAVEKVLWKVTGGTYVDLWE